MKLLSLNIKLYSIHRKSSLQHLNNVILKCYHSTIVGGGAAGFCVIANKITGNNNRNSNNNNNYNRLIRYQNHKDLFKFNTTINNVGNINQQFRQFSYIETITNVWTTMSNSAPVAYFQHGLIQFHDYTGLPWWASIILSTVLLRSIVTMPLTIYQNKIMARLELIGTEMPEIVKQLRMEATWGQKKYKWSEKQTKIIYARSLRKQYNNLIIRDNCHPLKTVLVLWFQIPLWIIQSITIRNLVMMLPDPTLHKAQMIYVEMTIGGFGWIPNLIEIDSSFILPIALGLLNLSIIEIQNMTRTQPPRKMQKYITYFFRGFSIMMIPIGASVPSCLCLYWTTSSAYGLIQNLLIMSPKVKRFVGIPLTKSELKNPYHHIGNQIELRLMNAKQKLLRK